MRAITSNKIQIRLKTLQKNGILLTLGKRNDYLTLEMYLGRIRLETNAGGGKIAFKKFIEIFSNFENSKNSKKFKILENSENYEISENYRERSVHFVF